MRMSHFIINNFNHNGVVYYVILIIVHPSGCHSLNLVVGDSETSCLQSTSFFVPSNKYMLFSALLGDGIHLKNMSTVSL